MSLVWGGGGERWRWSTDQDRGKKSFMCHVLKGGGLLFIFGFHLVPALKLKVSPGHSGFPSILLSFFGWFSVFGFFFLAYTLTYSVNHLSWSFMFFLPLLKLGGPGHNLFESCFLKSRTWQTTAFGCVSCKEVLMPNVFALEQAFTEVKSPSKRLHCLLNF